MTDSRRITYARRRRRCEAAVPPELQLNLAHPFPLPLPFRLEVLPHSCSLRLLAAEQPTASSRAARHTSWTFIMAGGEGWGVGEFRRGGTGSGKGGVCELWWEFNARPRNPAILFSRAQRQGRDATIP